jgi:hypothetical protein
MKTSELLQLQALKFKERVIQHNPDFDEVGEMPAWMLDDYDTNSETRNICGMIPLALFDEIQRLGGLLSISKRRMVEMALRDIAISANKAFEDVGFDPSSMTYQSAGETPVDQE